MSGGWNELKENGKIVVGYSVFDGSGNPAVLRSVMGFYRTHQIFGYYYIDS